ncbi:unnamed protein product [Phaedon cochleariae]|uniref:Gamma-glutamylcyclotransferase family protein n=1 Tax=Phaedon cochleariae TaxID=80249 RepID=A0A9P0DCJ0_PHACE|nr:unnamed protein product [Phaedon cochleariae]
MDSRGKHVVFVYGTLKKGEPNHSRFSKITGGSYKFLADAKTKEKYPLIITTKYNIPFLLESPGNGTHVKGELYEVDDKVLTDLDVLEDHPNFYTRKLYDVLTLDGQNISKVWIYMIEQFKPDLLNEIFYESYSSLGNHGKKFVERYNYSRDIVPMVSENYSYCIEFYN